MRRSHFNSGETALALFVSTTLAGNNPAAVAVQGAVGCKEKGGKSLLANSSNAAPTLASIFPLRFKRIIGKTPEA